MSDEGQDLPGPAGLFSRVADSYDAVGVPFFGPIADLLVAALVPQPGERVLDAGCGRGAVMNRVAAAVAPGGSVLGIDIAPGMVAATRADLRARPASVPVEVMVADATVPGLAPRSFDVVASSLVLFFLPDPPAALLSWRHLLRPGGRIGVTSFAGQDPRWAGVDEVFGPWLPPGLRDARTSGRRGPFGSDAGVEQLFGDAGLVEVQTVSGCVPVVFADPGQWEAFSWSVGQRAMWEAVPEPDRAAVRAEAFRRLAELGADDGPVTFTQPVRVTLGVAPH